MRLPSWLKTLTLITAFSPLTAGCLPAFQGSEGHLSSHLPRRLVSIINHNGSTFTIIHDDHSVRL